MSEQPYDNNESTHHTPGLPSPAPAMPHAVPAGYFEQLSNIIVERIRLESDELPAVLRSLKEKNAQQPGWPYQTPTGYFEQPPTAFSAPDNQAIVIPFRKRPLFRYAVAVAAAVLVTIFGVGRWYQQRSLPDIETDPANWVRNEIKKESTEKIDSYIDGSVVETIEPSAAHKKEIAQLTKDIDENEILLLLSETDLLASASSESGGSQKILN